MNITDVIDVSNHEQVARHLLEAKADVNKANAKGFVALMHASQHGHADVSAYRLEISFIIHHTIYFIDTLAT